jgi:hypothetical protein
LFAVHYEAVPDQSLTDMDAGDLQTCIAEDQNVLYCYALTCRYIAQKEQLCSYDATTALFEMALSDLSTWPVNDHAAKQLTHIDMLSPHHPLVKTGWSMRLFMQEFYDEEADLSDGDDMYQMVDAESSSDMSSDQMTVDG